MARRDGAPAKAQRKRVWWGEEVRRRERDLSRLSGARRGMHSPHRRDGGIDLLPGLLLGLPAWWRRSAGPNFSAMRHWGKNRQRRGLPPPCGIHPAALGGMCVLLCSALGRVGSHRWHGISTECTCFCVTLCFYRQGLTLVCNCSQLPEVWLPAAGTPLLQSRPGGGNHPVIGPVAMVAWCGGRDRGHSKGDGPNTSLTH